MKYISSRKILSKFLFFIHTDLIYLDKEKQGGTSRMWLEYFKMIPGSEIKAKFLVAPGCSNITKEYLKKVNFLPPNPLMIIRYQF